MANYDSHLGLWGQKEFAYPQAEAACQIKYIVEEAKDGSTVTIFLAICKNQSDEG